MRADHEKPRVGKVDVANVQKVVQGMYGVVNEGGTGVVHACPASVSAARPAPRSGSQRGREGRRPRNMKDNAWFVAFAPCEAPEIAVSALWESGMHGQLAAPIARDVLKAYFDKKARAAKRR